VLRVFIVNLDNNISTRLVEDLSKDGVPVKKLNGVSKIASFSSISGNSMIVIGEVKEIFVPQQLKSFTKKIVGSKRESFQLPMTILK